MLVYANNLSFKGSGAEDAIFKGIGAWLKEQLGFGLHPDQLRKDGEFNGMRGDVRSCLRIHATTEEEPELYSWILRFPDNTVYGRQWIVEVGFKKSDGLLDFSCIVKTDEHSTLVNATVTASQPRLIRYVVSNVRLSEDVDFVGSVTGVTVKSIGQDRDSYRGLLVELDHSDRDGPIVLVSPTREGEYLLNVTDLQEKLIGLAQVVRVSRDFNRYEMTEVLGQPRSAWDGAINILYLPTETGHVRGRYFLADAIVEWGDTQSARIPQVLALVTSNTNISRLRKHIRPEGVMQLALRRRMQAARVKSEQMSTVQLRSTLEELYGRFTEQAKFIDEVIDENSQLERTISGLNAELEDTKEELGQERYSSKVLKEQLTRAGCNRSTNVDADELLDLVCRTDAPSPLECLNLIEKIYSDRCIILDSAKASAWEANSFLLGRQLLDLLKRLVTDYRDTLMERGDNEARHVFGKGEYAAKESETVMRNREMRRQRTFEYRGEQVEMFRHLKIGVDDNVAKTIRVHFHWDADFEKIVIGYCGKHLPISTR
jgi:hypothetical protein